MDASHPFEESIGSFVFFDLETNNLPSPMSKVSITEISLCAIAANAFSVNRLSRPPKVPALPRVLHQLNLCFNPRQPIYPYAEQATGLSNELLKDESLFDENAATAIISFLQHQRAPVCLVAHNGNVFDFPVLKQSFKNLNMQLPNNVICLDSMRAFMGIDDQLESMERFFISPSLANDENLARAIINPQQQAATLTTVTKDSASESTEKIDNRTLNETTPQRPIRTAVEKRSIRAIFQGNNFDDEPSSSPSAATVKKLKGVADIKARRSLFTTPSKRKYPEKGRYPLGIMHERFFGMTLPDAHHAQTDTKMLLNLSLAYGVDFLAYALNHAKPFAEI